MGMTTFIIVSMVFCGASTVAAFIMRRTSKKSFALAEACLKDATKRLEQARRIEQLILSGQGQYEVRFCSSRGFSGMTSTQVSGRLH